MKKIDKGNEALEHCPDVLELKRFGELLSRY
jgi:hypothetical protein